MSKLLCLAVLLGASLPALLSCSSDSSPSLTGTSGKRPIVSDGSLTLDILLPNGEPAPDTLVLSLARPPTTINFSLPAASEFLLRIIDETGSAVFTIFGQATAGGNSVIIDLSGQSSGVYLMDLVSGNFHASRLLLLVKQ